MTENSNTFVCAYCKGVVNGAAHIVYGSVVHESCAIIFRANRNDRAHRCPQCNGAGKVDDLTRPTRFRPSPDDGMDGWFAPQKTEACEWERKQCDLCEGWGYLHKAPVAVTQHMGWRRG